MENNIYEENYNNENEDKEIDLIFSIKLMKVYHF